MVMLMLVFFKDPKMTDWLWEIKERAEQKERFIDYRKNRVIFFSPEEQHRRMIMKQRMVSRYYI